MTDFWSCVLADVQSQLRPDVYKTWFLPIDCTRVESDQVELSVPEDFWLSWFEDNYSPMLSEIMERHLGAKPRLEFRTSTDTRSRRMKRHETPSGIETKYTFNTFVVGDCNKFAAETAKGVANRPGFSYNPLFIYGKVGLGKTHLLHAIGNEIARHRPEMGVRYVTCEQFISDVVRMLRTGQHADAFRTLYRDECEVLLVDDVQFLTNKEKTQTEFFNVFNSLYGMNRQIVLSCDRYPREIPGLEERLQSRFQWGLVVDIEAPDLETRVAILQRKALNLDLHLPIEVAMLIATHIKSNVRELEGALQRLKAYIEVNDDVTVGMDTVRAALGNLLQEGNRRLSVPSIIQAVASYYSVSLTDMKGKGRRRAITTPRHVAMYLAKVLTGASYPTLGEAFGGRDHSTVISAVQKIEALVADPTSEISHDIGQLREVLDR